MSAPIITLLTDFGMDDAFVGVMKGVMLGICPTAQFVDLTHAIPPQDVRAGALVLRSAVGYFPADTVHLAVVDPGVGSARRPIVVETHSALLVGPDNGLLEPAAALLGTRGIYLIEDDALFHKPVSATFHGRDVFAPVAAHLSRGLPVHRVGRLLRQMKMLPLPQARALAGRLEGEVVYVDRFGNLVTNVAAELLTRFPGRGVSVSIGHTRVAGVLSAYAAVDEGTPLAIIGSWGYLEIAIRNGNAAQMLAAGPGTPVTVVGVQ